MAASRGEHAVCPPGTLLCDRYRVLKEAGCGNFSKVFKCVDTKSADQTTVAVKLLKKEYAADAAFENDILKKLTERDQRDTHKVLKLLDHFRWNRHPAFVFPLKGPCLRSRKLGVTRGNVTPSQMMALARELLRTLAFLHFDVKMVHTDLKPENILLDMECPAENAGIGAGWTVVDFGSASFVKPDKPDHDLISTRPYRAPEVVMGNSWSYPADVWSAACILYEVYAGSRLFEVHDDGEHLRQMEVRLGKLPACVTQRSKNSPRFFDSTGKMLTSRGKPAPSTTSGSKSPVRSVQEAMHNDPMLCDLLTRMLDFNPKTRLRADEALEHPYFISAEEQKAKIAAAASPCQVPTGIEAADMDAATRHTKPPLHANTLPMASHAAPPIASVAVLSHAKENLAAALQQKAVETPSATPTPYSSARRCIGSTTSSAGLSSGPASVSSNRAAMPPAGKPSGLFRRGTLAPGRYN